MKDFLVFLNLKGLKRFKQLKPVLEFKRAEKTLRAHDLDLLLGVELHRHVKLRFLGQEIAKLGSEPQYLLVMVKPKSSVYQFNRDYVFFFYLFVVDLLPGATLCWRVENVVNKIYEKSLFGVFRSCLVSLHALSSNSNAKILFAIVPFDSDVDAFLLKWHFTLDVADIVLAFDHQEIFAV